MKMTAALAIRAQTGTFRFESTLDRYFDPRRALSRAKDQVKREVTSWHALREKQAITRSKTTNTVAAASDRVA